LLLESEQELEVKIVDVLVSVGLALAALAALRGALCVSVAVAAEVFCRGQHRV
jgi:hypothetical protein